MVWAGILRCCSSLSECYNKLSVWHFVQELSISEQRCKALGMHGRKAL